MHIADSMLHSKTSSACALAWWLVACGSPAAPPQPLAGAGSSAAGSAGSAGAALSGAAGSLGGAAHGGGGAGEQAGGGTAAGSGGSAGTTPAVVCAPPEDVFSPIARLSQTGCVDPAQPTKPSASASSYEVNSPLWSDSADKTRAFLLPVGAKIHVRDCTAHPSDCPNGKADEGRWDFPVGSVLIKAFAFDGKLVETRLFMHLDESNWVGYSYQWDEAQTEATLVSADGADTVFDTGKQQVAWHYPSQKDCLNCHNAAGGSTLGLETAQLNRPLAGSNQIDALALRGLFETAPAKPYKAALVPPYPSQAGTPPAAATTEQKARSYLHANCGFCHRPGGNYPNFDFRFDTAFKDMNLCNAEVKKGAISSAPGKTKILVPGQASSSVMWLRMNEPDPAKGRMPQVASYAVDHDAVTLVSNWIQSIGACP